MKTSIAEDRHALALNADAVQTLRFGTANVTRRLDGWEVTVFYQGIEFIYDFSGKRLNSYIVNNPLAQETTKSLNEAITAAKLVG